MNNRIIYHTAYILLLLFCISFSLYSQKRTSRAIKKSCQEVYKINHMDLWAAYIVPHYPDSFELTDRYSFYTYLPDEVYYDASGNIRKLIRKGEMRNFIIQYYDENGFLCHMISDEGYTLGYALTLSLYAAGKPSSQVYHVYMDGFIEDTELIKISGKEVWKEIPEEVSRIPLTSKILTHVDSVKAFYNLTMKVPEMSRKVRFGLEEGFINGNFIEPQAILQPTEWELTYFNSPSGEIVPDAEKLVACQRAILAINKQPLKKIPICSTSSAEQRKNDQTIFIDTEGNIRKYVQNEGPYEDRYSLITYYDKAGELINLIYHRYSYDSLFTYTDAGRKCHDAKDKFEYGSICLDKGKLIYQTYTIETFDSNPVRLQGINKPVLPGLDSFDFTNLYHTDLLVESRQIDTTLLRVTDNSFASLSYVIPKNFINTFANGYQIEVRKEPDINSPVIGTLQAGRKISIREMMHQEELPGYGNYPWYKITYKAKEADNYSIGYVFGAFLEPVEDIWNH